MVRKLSSPAKSLQCLPETGHTCSMVTLSAKSPGVSSANMKSSFSAQTIIAADGWRSSSTNAQAVCAGAGANDVMVRWIT